MKISEIGSWLGRRNKTPQAVAGAFSRAFWRWQHKYCQTKRVGVAPFFQVVTAGMIMFYAFNYNRISELFVQSLVNTHTSTDFIVIVVVFYLYRAPRKLQTPLT